MDISNLQQALTKNRAEELGYDVWDEFVVPLFFDEIDLHHATKPRILVGGRGCGKTMLLRYLSHQSRFSARRESIPTSEIETIGIYWRADTQFVTSMSGRGIDEDIWMSAFGHSLAISVSREIIASLHSVADSAIGRESKLQLEAIDLSPLQLFTTKLSKDCGGIEADLQGLEWELQLWLNNPRTVAQPQFLPGRSFIRALIQILTQQSPLLAKTRFSVYIDEYENLLRYQQRILNTFLKHSEPPLVFHLAMKRNGMQTKETLGEESISDIADYRTIDLDSLIERFDFATYAAEIFLLRTSKVPGMSPPISLNLLKSPDRLAERREQEYRKTIDQEMNKVFPSLQREELAEVVFEEPALLSQLTRSIEAGLKRKGSRLSASDFVRKDYKQASLIVPALLHRGTVPPELVLAELKLLQQGKDNRFTGATNWIHNNFEGCLLYLYAPFDRTCPFYAGFNTYVQLACANLRHFLELCYKAFKRMSKAPNASPPRIPPKEQAEAAKQASAAFIAEIKGFGRMGIQLHTFVITLGSLFALSQRRASQSEPEVSHFTIVAGGNALTPDDQAFFSEAVKWSVLLEEPATKLKDPLQPFESDWVLNPIYAPYFHITYRKRRKLDLRANDIAVLIRGTLEDRRTLLKSFSQRWSLEPIEEDLPLFSSHLA